MSLRRPLTAVLAASALVGSGVLSGCGLTSTQFRPGEAARIDGETIEVSEVDEVAAGMCDVLVSDQRFEGQTFAGATIRNAAQRGLALHVMGEALLEEYDVSLPEGAGDGAAAVRSSYTTAEPDDLEAAMPAFTGDQFLFEVLVALGRDEIGDDAPEEEALPAGVARAQEWQESADLETNPAFDAVTIGEDQVLTTRDDLSVATSDFATSAGTDADGGAAELPASQRCGG